MNDSDSSVFKIKDNRRFDEQGNDRELENEAVTVSVKDSPKTETKSRVEEESQKTDGFTLASEPVSSEDGEAVDINFRSLVISLATQALMQMGIAEPPQGVSVTLDKQAAKQTIDIISMLEVKTRGNLDAEEKQLMEEVLFSLRTNFLKVS